MIRKEKKTITESKGIVQNLHDHYVVILERFFGEKPTSIAKEIYLTDDITTVDHIIHHYEGQLSVRQIKKR